MTSSKSSSSSSSSASNNIGCWTNFRKNGIKSAKSLFSSAGDIASDWVYYMKISQQDNFSDTIYHKVLFIICCISSVMGLLLIVSLIGNARQNRQRILKRTQKDRRFKKLLKLDSFNATVKSILALEIFLEDIPQFVLVTLITHELNGGELTTYAVFNITFSALNLIFNVFDMIELEDDLEENIESAKELVSDAYRTL